MTHRGTSAVSAALAVLAILIGLLNMGTALVRSTIPISLDGQVALVQRRHGGVAGSDVWLVVMTDGREHHVDAAVARGLAKGDRVSKAAWSTTIDTSRGSLAVRPGWELSGSFVITVGALILIGIVHGHARRMDTLVR